MANDISFLPASVLSRCRNVNYAMVDQKIDALDSFKVVLAKPSSWQITDIVDDVEAKITIGSHAVYGYVKNHQYNKTDRILTITGKDYMIKLAGMFIHTDNVTQEDAGLSSAFRVVYTTKAFAVIAADLITNSGFAVGTIDTFPVAGPDTNMSVKLEDMYVRAGLNYLANYANVSDITYDVWIDTSKQLQLQDRRGSASSVKDYRDGINCNVLNFEGDTIRKAKRVLVRGDRSGASQVTGLWPAAGFTPGDPEVGFYMPGLTDQTMATQLAKNLYTALGGEITFIELRSGNVNDNVQMGDLITLTSKELSISATDYRVVRIIREYWRDRELLRLFLSISTNKQRKKTLVELLSANKGLTRLTGSVTKGEIKTLTFAFIGKTHGTNKNQAVINLSTTDIAADSDIIGARLTFKRLPITYDVGANTDNSVTNAGMTNNQTVTNAGMTNAASNSNAGMTNNQSVTNAGMTNNQTVSNAGVTNVAEVTNAGMTNTVAGGSAITVMAAECQGAWGGNVNFENVCGVACTAVKNSDGFGAFSIQNNSGSLTNYFCRIYDPTRALYLPDAGGVEVRILAGYSGNAVIQIPWDVSSRTCEMQIKSHNGNGAHLNTQWSRRGEHFHANTFDDANHTNPNTFDDANHTNPNTFNDANHTNANTFDDAPHTNINTFDDANHTNPNTFDDANHANPLARSVFAPGGEAAYNFNIDIGGVNRATANNINVGNVSSEIDLGAWINTRGTHYVEIYPTGAAEKAILVGEIQVDYWSESL